MRPEQVHVTFARAIAGDFQAREEALAIALRGWSVWMRCGGTVDIGRCMGIPVTASGKRYAKMRRDFHLVKAFALCAGTSIPQRCAILAAAARRFMSDIWPRWRDLDQAPFGVSEIKLNLFLAAQALPERMELSPRQIARIVTSFGPEVSAALTDDEASYPDMGPFMEDDFDLGLIEGQHYQPDGTVDETSLAVLVLGHWRQNPELRAHFADSIGLFEDHVLNRIAVIISANEE